MLLDGWHGDGPTVGRTLDCLSIENVTFCTATFMAHDGIPAESKGHQMRRRRPSRRYPLGKDIKYVVYDILYQGFSSSGYLTFNFVPPRLRSRSDGQSSRTKPPQTSPAPPITPVTITANRFFIPALGTDDAGLTTDEALAQILGHGGGRPGAC